LARTLAESTLARDHSSRPADRADPPPPGGVAQTPQPWPTRSAAATPLPSMSETTPNS